MEWGNPGERKSFKFLAFIFKFGTSGVNIQIPQDFFPPTHEVWSSKLQIISFCKLPVPSLTDAQYAMIQPLWWIPTNSTSLGRIQRPFLVVTAPLPWLKEQKPFILKKTKKERKRKTGLGNKADQIHKTQTKEIKCSNCDGLWVQYSLLVLQFHVLSEAKGTLCYRRDFLRNIHEPKYRGGGFKFRHAFSPTIHAER